MPGLSGVWERPRRNGRVTQAIDWSIDASRFSLAGTCADVARGAARERSRALTWTMLPVDSGAAGLVDVLRTPKESAFQRSNSA